MGWCYGLVEDKGQLVLHEIYFNDKGEPHGGCLVTWKELEEIEKEEDQDIKRTIKYISEDIAQQIRTKNFIYWNEKDGIKLKKKSD